MKKKRSLCLSLLLAAVLALGLFTGCGSAAEQENSSTLHSIASETQEMQEDADSQEADAQAQEADDQSPEADEQTQEEESQVIEEDGTYTSRDDVALYIHTYGKLPSNFITKKEAEKLGWSGGSLEPYAPGKCIGGNYFGNYEGVLPEGNYKECDIDTLGKEKRGAKRIVYSDDGRIYYTEDHYESFTQLY